MFHKLWANRQTDKIVLEKLPYFVFDPSTNNLVEMTNCSVQHKKQLGWYEVVFVNNQGNRANTFYEDMCALVYNETADRVECHSFKLKDNWRHILYSSLEEKVLSLQVEENQQQNISTWLNRVKSYFFNPKYDDYQIAQYHNILNSLSADFVSVAKQQIYTNSKNIRTIEFVYPSGIIYRQKDIISEFVSSNLEVLQNKKVALTGIGCHQEAVLLRKNNISCSVIDHQYFSLNREIFTTPVVAVMHAILNDVFINVVEDVDYSFDEDNVIIFNGAFDEQWAEKNWNVARKQKERGKQVLICSPSIWSGSNETIKVNQNNLEVVFEYNGDLIFAPKV